MYSFSKLYLKPLTRIRACTKISISYYKAAIDIDTKYPKYSLNILYKYSL